ncbi:MFS transporter, putative [Penicillium digitatum PHI26]|uniref:MFS transporter, putative n=3 Tax=Penicillium digitatum TaxID=36651 RepID=K9GGA7_PEND2|nr:MFS transporter, putative [Penicillium digitatum Pd1]EKV20014.1 MFS transporter, putative [Penicillium digitatum PHI26]EKV21853.1 MFS transporter, putative [Penicillium digitatum Pd1]
MVTAVLPTITGTTFNDQVYRASTSSELTITPERARNGHSINIGASTASPSARLSGFVGMCAGCGALVALVVFLPLAAQFEKMGLSPAQAIQRSYYLVAVVSLVICLVCSIGLRDLPGEKGKNWSALWKTSHHCNDEGGDDDDLSLHRPTMPYWKQLATALQLGFRHRSIGLGYVGGFVARASSVAISLFIPLAVNHYYRVSGLCNEEHEPVPGSGLGDIKKACPRAYIVASILTGVSQLVALIAAPAFGYLTDKSRRYNFPLLFAAFVGTIGYISFAMLPNPLFERPDGNPGVFVVMALLGTSQIGAIVCSLAVLSNGILRVNIDSETIRSEERRVCGDENVAEPDEGHSLLAGSLNQRLEHLSHLKGSIAGVYSLYGGAGILLLTKVGGLLFDILSASTPFYLMAGFNGVLLVLGIVCGGINHFGSSTGRAW